MDYFHLATLVRHASWTAFCRDRPPGRLVLLTTAGATRLPEAVFQPDDVLLLGRESAESRPRSMNGPTCASVIPLQAGARSLNVALSAAMVLGEALRQTSGFEKLA